MRIFYRNLIDKLVKSMAPKASLNQPKITKLVRQRSPESSSADERPAKKLLSTTASESDTDPAVRPKSSHASGSMSKISEKSLAAIFNPKLEQTATGGNLAKEIKEKRVRLYKDITEFRFNKKRVRVLSDAKEIPDESQGIVYWMSRDQRVQGKNRHLLLRFKIQTNQKFI